MNRTVRIFRRTWDCMCLEGWPGLEVSTSPGTVAMKDRRIVSGMESCSRDSNPAPRPSCHQLSILEIPKLIFID